VGALALLLGASAHAKDWQLRVSEKDGLPILNLGGQPMMTSGFVFWGADWKWAAQPTAFRIVGPLRYAIDGNNRRLGFRLQGTASSPQPATLSWDFTLNAPKAVEPAIGGGISFRFPLGQSSPSSQRPELLPGNAGWRWNTATGAKIEMRFEPALDEVTLERRRGLEIRGFFYSGSVPKGERRYRATLTVSGNAEVAETTAERFGIADHRQWPNDILDLRTSPVDLAFLNDGERPAGHRGFVKAEDDQLVFEDGTPARFWGTNLTAAAIFRTSRDGVRVQARRLAQLGFNLVRIHHHDSGWVNPNIFGGRDRPDTLTLSKQSLEQLDWWIHCLKEEGIYVWLDLHVGRPLRAGDGIEGFDEIARGKPTAQLKGYSYVNESIQAAMRRFNEQYLNHVNVHTGVAYRAEPAIVALLITNENDVTHHFGNSLLPNKNVPWHNRLYMDAAREFAAHHDLPANRVWRSWEPGPSKLFLNDLEHRFNQAMISHLRSLGTRAGVVTTSTWGGNPLSSLPALTDGDIIDVHSYGKGGEIGRDPVRGTTLIHWLAAAQVAGKPLSVTEWNLGSFPLPDRHSLPLQVAASARLHGWDALMQYAYAQIPLDGGSRPSNWHTFNDPSMIGMLPAAALLYRRGDVAESKTVYAFAPDPTTLFDRQLSPASAVALRTAAERGKLVIALPQVPELPWLRPNPAPKGAIVFDDPSRSFITTGASGVVSDSGELARDWNQETYTIDTPRTQAVTGWIGGRTISLADVDFSMSTRYASVAVQSLDTEPVSTSRQLLISLAARALFDGGRKGSFRAEPVLGELSIRAPSGLELYAVGGLGRNKPRELAVSYEEGRYRVTLDEDVRSYWLLLKRPAG